MNNLKYFKCKRNYLNKTHSELIYDIKINKDEKQGLINSIQKINGVDTINVVASNTDTMG